MVKKVTKKRGPNKKPVVSAGTKGPSKKNKIPVISAANDVKDMEGELNEMSDSAIESANDVGSERPSTSAPAPSSKPALAKKPEPEDQKDLREEKNKEHEAQLEDFNKKLVEKANSLEQREVALAQKAKDLEKKEQDIAQSEAASVPAVPNVAMTPVIEPKEEVNSDLSFFDRPTSGELVFSNRTHFELIFSDLGFPSPGDKFDSLRFAAYQERDLEKEGFTSDQVIRSKNLRNFIASGKMKHGKLEEKDKLPENTKFASIRNLGSDVTSIGVKFTGHYFDLYQKFVAKEKQRYKRAEV